MHHHDLQLTDNYLSLPATIIMRLNVCSLYLEQFLLFTTGVFFFFWRILHPSISHAATQLSKDITLIVYQAIIAFYLSVLICSLVMQKQLCFSINIFKKNGLNRRKNRWKIGG